MIQVKRMSHVTLETPDLERQIDYFTQVVGLQEAGRENGTAFLATKVGDIVVRVEKGSEARCARIAFQVDPATDLGDGLHPNQQGYEKMADAWVGAIEAVPEPGSLCILGLALPLLLARRRQFAQRSDNKC